MEIRVWSENGDLMAHAVIRKVTMEHDVESWEVEPHPFYAEESTEVTHWPTESMAVRHANQEAARWKQEAEDDFTEQHGEKPTGVMSETGFSIQEVEDE